MAIKQTGFEAFLGVSTDPKPTVDITEGATFYETDTNKHFMYDGAVKGWRQVNDTITDDFIIPWTDTTFTTDDIVMFNNILYKAKADIITPTGANPSVDIARWDRYLGSASKKIEVSDFGVWQPSTAYTLNDLVTYHGIIYRAKGAVANTVTTTPDLDTTNWERFVGGGTQVVSLSQFKEWDKDTDYSKDDVVHHLGVMYTCIDPIVTTPGASNPEPGADPTHWKVFLGLGKSVLTESEFVVWSPNTAYPVSTLVISDGVLYKARAPIPNTLTAKPHNDDIHWEVYLKADHKDLGAPIGSIIMFPTVKPPKNYLLCNGGTFDASKYYELSLVLGGNTLPDLRDQFVRGASLQTDIDGFAKIGDSTKMPNNQFTTSIEGVHDHAYRSGAGSTNGIKSGDFGGMTELGWIIQNNRTDRQGGHQHTVNGGDAETAPKHVKMAYHIKADHVIHEARALETGAVTISRVEPPKIRAGQFWFDSDNGDLYILTNNNAGQTVDNFQWIQINT